MNPLDKQSVDQLSYSLFENTIKHGLSRDMIAKSSHTDSEEVLRLQSGNPFVKQESFDRVKAFIDSLDFKASESDDSKVDNTSEILTINSGTITQMSSLLVEKYFARNYEYKYAVSYTDKQSDIKKAFVVLADFMPSTKGESTDEVSNNQIIEVKWHGRKIIKKSVVKGKNIHPALAKTQKPNNSLAYTFAPVGR